jgi:hypothetical protein
MRVLASSVLVFEALVILFATLVATDLSDIDQSAVWVVGAAGMVACVILTALLRYRWAYAAGSVLQVLLVVSGVVVPTMFFLGAVFAVLWFLALYLGRKVELLEQRRRSEP